MAQTHKRWRSRLPHWEVEGHWHFITIRCHGSLPKAILVKIREIHEALDEVDAQSEAFLQLQRRYFLTIDKYLDKGSKFAPFHNPHACKLCLDALAKMEPEGWLVGEATIMPNHLHMLILKQRTDFSLKQILERFKGRTSRIINQHLQRSERFWQEDWFDRWMRNEGEIIKTIAYIRNNSVKAGIVKHWQDHPWRISEKTVL